MPIYEYECLKCGRKFEVIQKFTDNPLEICSQCGGHVHKLISHSSFILKGNGWYVTDYARANKKKEEVSQGKPETGKKKTAAKTGSTPKAEVTAKNK